MNPEVIKSLAALITAAFGLIAALAWNTAIQEIFRVFFGEQSGILAFIMYAVIVTIIAVIATIGIGRVAARAGLKDEKQPLQQEFEALTSEVRSLREEMKRVRDRQAARDTQAA